MTSAPTAPRRSLRASGSEAEYGADGYVCNPGQSCPPKRRFATFCRIVYAPPGGFSAVKFDVDLNGKVFYPCPRGT